MVHGVTIGKAVFVFSSYASKMFLRRREVLVFRAHNSALLNAIDDGLA